MFHHFRCKTCGKESEGWGKKYCSFKCSTKDTEAKRKQAKAQISEATISVTPKVIELHSSGMGMRRIIKTTGLASSTISRILRRNGIAPHRVTGHRLTKDQRTEKAKASLFDVIAKLEKKIQVRSVKKVINPMRLRDAFLNVAQRASGKSVFKFKYDTSPEFRILILLRRRMRKVIKEGVKSGSSLELLGCTTEQIRAHLQSQFKAGMTWENMGQWHIDHVIPCAHFDLTREDHQRTCFNWSNLQPLWGKDNLEKGARLSRDCQINLPLCAN